MNRLKFISGRLLYANACVLNRFHACVDCAEFIEATEFSNAFDEQMNRANRASFWEAA